MSNLEIFLIMGALFGGMIIVSIVGLLIWDRKEEKEDDR